jgi:hypothetical protein
MAELWEQGEATALVLRMRKPEAMPLQHRKEPEGTPLRH